MRARRSADWLIALAMCGLLAGCATGPTVGSDPGDPDQVEVFTSWTSGTDRVAYKALAGVFLGQNPGIEFIDASVRGSAGSQAREALAARFAAGNPPDTFQTEVGGGIAAYVDAGRLQDLTDWYAQNDLASQVYRTDMMDLLSVDGRLYAVPSSINRVNVLWANTGLLADAGVGTSAPSADLDGWLADLAEVRASGIEFPLALGEGRTQVELFENVLIADLGPGAYRKLWTSTDGWDAPLVRRALEHYDALLGFVDPADSARGDDALVAAVARGRAAYVVMADVASGMFEDAGLVFGDQYTGWPTPGTAGTFDFTADAFVLPVGAAHERSAERWLLSVASPEGQRVFNLRMGSIPARVDADPAGFSDYQQSAMASFAADTLVPSAAHGIAASRTFSNALEDAVVRFGVDRNSGALIRALTAAAEQELAKK
ncbi:MAG: sugar transporter substrate-binding protein [Schumannella sp.]|nr:sugar transporter substrate-binding protein [Schumannella sp.]